MSAPLQGITVLDLSRVLAGPYCTMILGDLGADVIKVEHPDGDETRQWGPPFIGSESAYYLSVNRNKRSITADFRNDNDVRLIKRIASDADVLVENYLPGSLDRAGLNLAKLREANPRLVTLTVSGMGASGPERDLAGYDFIVQASSGLMSITGEPAGTPSKVGVAVVDLTTGMMAANAVLAALFARERTGKGQHIDISLLETAISWLANVGTSVLTTGVEATRYGNAHPTIVPYQTFKTQDGEIAIGVGNDGQFQRFCAALGFEQLSTDPRYRTNPDRVRHRHELIEDLTQRLKEFTTHDCATKLKAARVPVSKVMTVGEALSQPQIKAREMIRSIEHPAVGEIRLLGIPYKFSHTPAAITRHPPMLGEHNEEVRTQYGN